jgi:hypothetical protein
VTEPTDTLGAVLRYEVRCNDAATQPLRPLIGPPMGAAGFATWPCISPTGRS